MREDKPEIIRDDAFYEELGRAVEAHEYTVGPAEYGPTHLQRGRPAGGTKGGPSPARALRLPAELDAALEKYIAETGMSLSEAIRQAVAEYLDRHSHSGR